MIQRRSRTLWAVGILLLIAAAVGASLMLTGSAPNLQITLPSSAGLLAAGLVLAIPFGLLALMIVRLTAGMGRRASRAYAIDDAIRACPDCGQGIESHWRACPHCGARSAEDDPESLRL